MDPYSIHHEQLPRNFTIHHRRLLAICFGEFVPTANGLRQLGRTLVPCDLEVLGNMVELEFFTSMLKDRQQPPEGYCGKEEPHPFDVFLMERTLQNTTAGGSVAVCVPIKDKLFWFNGKSNLFPIKPPSHMWRIASLSGTARILETLRGPLDDYPLMEAALRRKMIQGAARNVRKPFSIESEEWYRMNESQRQAVATVADGEDGFFVVQGPPGCGKTTVLVSMIMCCAGQVLVTAPSNAAVANVALKLWESGRFSHSEMVVYGEGADPSVHFLHPGFRSKHFSRLNHMWHHTESDARKEQIRLECVRWLRLQDEQPWTMSDMSRICPFLDMETSEGRNLYGSLIKRATVVFSTLNGSGSGLIKANVRAPICFLDEASQCTEAEFLILTTVPKARRIVVIGDPMQLPPTVIDMDCRKFGYGRSWIENVKKLQPSGGHILNVQYRMHPSLLRFPNEMFYGGLVRSGEAVHSRTPILRDPIKFVDTSGKSHEEHNDCSWRNDYESVVVKVLLNQDEDIRELLKHESKARVLVITPYKAQVQLLRQILTKDRRQKLNINVSTVDAFQGQEADVVILSLVRTRRVGFIDNSQRLNVAMTRAKRVLRIVGDKEFFLVQKEGSVLRALVNFSSVNGWLEKSSVRGRAWGPPNWTDGTIWKAVMNQKFVACIDSMQTKQRNICLNVLYSLCAAQIDRLSPVPEKSSPSWYTSFLLGFQDTQIVWIARELDKQSIEAVFAGSRSECLKFRQTNINVPDVARTCRRDLTGLLPLSEESSLQGNDKKPFWVSWPVTNSTQRAVLDRLELPSGGVQLDHHQELVARSPPPLIIESRSGTGKTLVLLQHAAYHANNSDSRPLCFITVSNHLRNELERRYNFLNETEGFVLPPVCFFTLRDFLRELCSFMGIDDFENSHVCTYMGYASTKRSFEKSKLEPRLVENEIGGVITGSLVAAIQGKPLSLQQYLEEKRSNMGRSFDDDRAKRTAIYHEFECYQKWKSCNEFYDTSDVAFRLLSEDIKEVFASAYIDEIQDFSYALVFLVCKVAGKGKLSWICAGDPAQMISAGCSFTFDGLKQTLLAVRSGIEQHLTRVHHLGVNYRTTKDVLDLANAILATARASFPRAIPFARNEIAKKTDLLPVVLCDRNLAFQTSVELGTNQAVVYSSTDNKMLEKSIFGWTGPHPFVLSSLESKGLEFDEVIIVFEMDRKTWRLESDASLNMLRELYVAVTRAQRRLVILHDNSCSEMKSFLRGLNCDFLEDGADLVLESLGTITTRSDWREKAIGLLRESLFAMAAKCFDAAGDVAFFHYARGKDFESKGILTQSNDEYARSLERFSSEDMHSMVLEIAMILQGRHMTRAARVSPMIEKAMRAAPETLSSFDRVKLALSHNLWNEIYVDDLTDSYISTLFVAFRSRKELKRIVEVATELEQSRIAESIPELLIELHLDRHEFHQAVKYGLSISTSEADFVTTFAIDYSKASNKCDELPKVAKAWYDSLRRSENPQVTCFLSLFRNPRAAEKRVVMERFGRSIVSTAVSFAGEDKSILWEFGKTEFFSDVTQHLLLRDSFGKLDVMKWFRERGDEEYAMRYVRESVSVFNDLEMQGAIELMSPPPEWLLEAAESRNFFPKVVARILGSRDLSITWKQSFIAHFVAYNQGHKRERDQNLSVVVWCLEKIVEKRPKMRSETSLVQMFVMKLLELWPDRMRSKAKKSRTLTQCQCQSLLIFAHETLPNDQRKHELLKELGKRKSGLPKVFHVMTLLNLKHKTKMKEAIRLTEWGLNQSDVADDQLFQILDQWIAVGRPGPEEPFKPSLCPLIMGIAKRTKNRALQFAIAEQVCHQRSSFTKKQTFDTFGRDYDLVENALQNSKVEIAGMVTHRLLRQPESSSIKLICSYLEAWSAHVHSHHQSREKTKSFDYCSLSFLVTRDPRAIEWFCSHRTMTLLKLYGPNVTRVLLTSKEELRRAFVESFLFHSELGKAIKEWKRRTDSFTALNPSAKAWPEPPTSI